MKNCFVAFVDKRWVAIFILAVSGLNICPEVVYSD